MPRRIDRWAKLSLVLAAALALLGLNLQLSNQAPFWGGLLLAFGEAALVGGLADWFAVRALFVRPLGLPFPHSALIPRNRKRITHEICELILKEWLPIPVLRARVEAFDFVGAGVLPVLEPLRPRIRELLRELGRELLLHLPTAELARLSSTSLAGTLHTEQMRSFLAGLLRDVRLRDLLEPVLNGGLRQLRVWAESRETWHRIRGHLHSAADRYQNEGLARTLAFSVAEIFGGLDLDAAAADLQNEICRFADDQVTGSSPLKDAVARGLAALEERVRSDPHYLDSVRSALLQEDQPDALTPMIEALLTTLCRDGLRELERDDSWLLATGVGHLDRWLAHLGENVEARAEFNGWCRSLAGSLLERYHPTLGTLVEEQLDRFTDQALTALIESRVGEDLNWIRLNGTFVGGFIGVVLYLLFRLSTGGVIK